MSKIKDFGRQLGYVALAAGLLCTFVGSAAAIPILPGDTEFAPSEPGPVGGKLEASLSVPLVAKTFSGVLHSDVYSGDLDNKLGGLTFTYWIENVGPNSLSRLTVSDFAGFATDMSYEPTGTPVFQIPTLVDRSAGSGDVVGFSFIGAILGSGKIAPGTRSALLVVQTDAKAFAETTAAVINGSTANPASFAPTAIVPEPGTLALASLGMVGLVGFARRRRRA